jgi:hypothetical protein
MSRSLSSTRKRIPMLIVFHRAAAAAAAAAAAKERQREREEKSILFGIYNELFSSSLLPNAISRPGTSHFRTPCHARLACGLLPWQTRSSASSIIPRNEIPRFQSFAGENQSERFNSFVRMSRIPSAPLIAFQQPRHLTILPHCRRAATSLSHSAYLTLLVPLSLFFSLSLTLSLSFSLSPSRRFL